MKIFKKLKNLISSTNVVSINNTNGSGNIVIQNVDDLSTLKLNIVKAVSIKSDLTEKEIEILKFLQQHNLSEQEADIFYKLLRKLKLSEKEIEVLDKEWKEALSFERGMSFEEAILNLIIVINSKN